MQRNIRLRLLSNVVILYMLLAFAWWSFLLFAKNKDAFEAKAAYNKLVMIADHAVHSDKEFLQTQLYKDLEEKYRRQEWMILGEAVVFIISLVIGVWLINRGYNKEIDSAQQRRNFLLSITHELKSPIASIQLVLETFRKRKLQAMHIDQLSQNALKETERLNDLVNDLLLAAKVETAYQPHLESINISKLLKDLIGRLRNKYPKVQFDLYQPEEEILLQADKTGLTSVALNLLENAAKYNAENPKVSTVLQNSNGKIQIEFVDNGIGIPDKEKNRIFERFYRVGNEDTRKTKGTGLGLYIVDQIIQAHGGKISVRDNRPKGTIFTISLPFNHP